MNSTSPDPIFNSFSAATKDDWLKAAQLELGDTNPFQKLTFEKENLTFLPYYDQHDHDVNKFNQLRPSSNEFLGSRAWHNMPLVNVNLESKAMSVGSGQDGGYLVPPEVEAQIGRLLSKASPMRQIADVRQVSATLYKKPFNTTGASAGWTRAVGIVEN